MQGEQSLTMKDPGAASVVELAALVERVREGDVRSFEEIMTLYENRVFRISCRLLNHRQDAEDASQEVFLRLYKYLHRFDGTRELAPWLYRMTVNVCHDLARKRRPDSPIVEAAMPAVPSSAAESVEREQRRQVMAEGIRSLPEKERAALVLRDIEGLSTQEVARVLGSTETTVRSQISRARIKLKEFRDGILGRQS